MREEEEEVEEQGMGEKREIDEGSCLGPPPPTPAGSTVSCRCRLLSDVARLVFVYIQELVLSEMVSCLARPNDILLIKRH